ncbi:MAG: adenylate/guanylate cyclase domain-containing protein [Verrucomicrobia subdivision 3 bacterium]|nr:adenylate/guanylate cyclase domain-containing protein [Limisphaerales bacterium]
MAGKSKRRHWLAAFILGASIVAGVGAVLIAGGKLADASYDLPFSSGLRTDIATPEVTIVYLDAESGGALQQTNAVWDRDLHARLLETLTRLGAKLVFFDITFFQPRDFATDQRLAAAMRENGKVVLSGDYDVHVHQSGIAFSETVALKAPLELFRTNAYGWGVIRLRPVDETRTPRTIFTGLPQKESAIWVAAELAGAPATRTPEGRAVERWFNFYGPPYTLRSINLANALSPADTNLFGGKFVFVGGHPSAFSRDQFPTPYTRIGKGTLAPGVEILATGFLNLVRGDWLTRMSTANQLLLVITWGVLSVYGLMLLRPWHAAWVAACATVGIAILSFYLHWHQRLWWSWLVPAAVQTPMALVWSVGYQYAFEYRQRRKLRKAFSIYLPPPLVERISEMDADLGLGGKEVEATVMFTDLEGFTAISETVTPTELSELLTTYFNRTTKHILEQEGTIIKYIGDSVMAVWGAPLEDANQAERSVLAALGMVAAGRELIKGRRLRTRVGINTGLTLAGNLGSDFRFDYTVIGATTNLASRLESLNQLLGTDILVSESTRQRLSEKIKVRRVGRFQLKGISSAVGVFEVIDLSTLHPLNPSTTASVKTWISSFEEALTLFSRCEFPAAEKLLKQVIAMRGGKDGPSEFYLGQIATLRTSLPSAKGWDGVITADTKSITRDALHQTGDSQAVPGT